MTDFNPQTKEEIPKESMIRIIKLLLVLLVLMCGLVAFNMFKLGQYKDIQGGEYIKKIDCDAALNERYEQSINYSGLLAEVNVTEWPSSATP